MKLKKLLHMAFASFLAGFLISGPINQSAFARLTGTKPALSAPDVFCVGRASYETCVDWTGNLLPTTTNNQTLGTSSLRWSTINSVLGNFSGTITGVSETLTGTLTVVTTTGTTNVTSQYINILPNLSITVTTPTVTGQLGVTSAGVLYIATGAANTGSWVKVGAQ